MKQFVSFFLMVCLALLTVSCFSEEADIFSFRNEIHFGDSVEEVLSKEDPGFDKEEKKNGSVYLTLDKIKLSGFEDCGLAYFFEDNKLIAINVFYEQNSQTYYDTNLLEPGYQKIEEGLTRKYGEPTETDPDEIESFGNGAVYYYGYRRGFRFEHATQRIISVNNNKLIIEHTLVYQRGKSRSSSCLHILSYQMIDQTNTNQIIDNDL